MNKTNAVIARQRSLTVSEVKVLVEPGFNPRCCREKNRYQEEKSMNIKHASQATRVLKTNTSSGFLFFYPGFKWLKLRAHRQSSQPTVRRPLVVQQGITVV